MKLPKIVIVLSLFFAVSCSDNLFEGNISNDSSGAAREESLRKALNEGKYQDVIDGLQGKSLNDYERYILQCAYIGSTGISTLDKIDAFLEQDKDLTDALMGLLNDKFDSPDTTVIASIRASYKNVKDLAAGSTDKDILFAAGIVAALDTFMITAEIASALGGGSFDFNPDSPNYIGKKFDALQASNVTPDMVTAVADNVGSLEQTLTSMEGGKQMKEKLDEYLSELTGGTGNSADVTDTSIVDFINKFFKKP